MAAFYWLEGPLGVDLIISLVLQLMY